MFFGAYFGTEDGTPRWRDALGRHADWLGLARHLESRRSSDGTVLELAWLRPDGPDLAPIAPVRERDGCLVTTALGAPAVEPRAARTPHELEAFARGAAAGARAVTLAASLPADTVCIIVPPATPQQAFYTRTPHGYVFGDDLRLFSQLVGTEPDLRGVYGLLQYGAVPAPLTLLRGVHRVAPGHVLRLDVRTGSRPAVAPFFASVAAHAPNGDGRPAETRLRDTLDDLMRDVPPATVLYFSGGVDSALLASRLARLGRMDVRLVNYSFGPDDPESTLAARVASHLGLVCERVSHDAAKVGAVLERLGTDYAVPFGDCSTIPTNILVHESLSWTGDASVVLEGTGADGAFGVGASYPQWRGVYAAPAMLRRSLGAAYDWLGLWRRASSLERVGRAVRKSASLPLAQAAVVYHALDGIAYATPPDVQRELLGVIETGIDVMSAGATPEERFSLLDLVLVCAGRMAPKSFDPLRTRGIRPLYPFLDPSMLALSASLPWALKCAEGSAKSLLKSLLAREIPPAWVYRPKSGFTPPYRELFASVPLQAFLHDVMLSRDNPLLAFCRPGVLRQLVDAAAHRRLGAGGYDFLWTLAFASGWLAQLPRRTARRGGELACAAS